MDNKKQEILQTAYRLIRTNGFDSFSYHDLSKAVGITKASIHYHFQNKEELGLAICDVIIQQFKWLQTAVENKSTAREKFDLYVETISAQVEDGLMCPISSLQAEYSILPDSMKRKIKDITHTELNMVAGILQQGLDQGEFHFEGEALDQAALLVTAYKSATLYSRVLEYDVVQIIIDQFSRQL